MTMEIFNVGSFGDLAVNRKARVAGMPTENKKFERSPINVSLIFRHDADQFARRTNERTMNDTKQESPAPKRGGWMKKLIWAAGGLLGLVVVFYFVVTSGGFLKSVVLPKVG